MDDDKQTKEHKNEAGEQGSRTTPESPPWKGGEGEVELEDLKTELEACKKQAEEYLNGWKRAKADYINLKKETETASAELAQFVAIGMMLKILPVYDGLKKACAAVPEGDKWAEGISNIKKQFEEVFKSFDIEEIKTVGEKFNPEFHEAVAREKREGVESDIVIEEVSGGYTMGGKTIIPAKVIVSE